jgi:hypothetical protein
MKKISWIVVSVLLTSIHLQAQSDTFQSIAKRFLSAKEKSYQQTATKENINEVLNFCSDTIKYNHVLSPEKKFSFTGKAGWRSGAISHLGETRKVKLQVLNNVARQNIVIIEYTLYREFKTDKGWQNSKGTIISLMEFDRSGKISRLTDYL